MQRAVLLQRPDLKTHLSPKSPAVLAFQMGFSTGISAINGIS